MPTYQSQPPPTGHRGIGCSPITQVTVSLPPELIDRVDGMIANFEGVTRSSYIAEAVWEHCREIDESKGTEPRYTVASKMKGAGRKRQNPQSKDGCRIVSFRWSWLLVKVAKRTASGQDMSLPRLITEATEARLRMDGIEQSGLSAYKCREWEAYQQMAVKAITPVA